MLLKPVLQVHQTSIRLPLGTPKCGWAFYGALRNAVELLNNCACCMCNTLLKRHVQGLLVQLKQEDDEVSQLDALGQLNELLSISNEESLSMFPLDQLIPTLVGGMPCSNLLPHPHAAHSHTRMPPGCRSRHKCETQVLCCQRHLSLRTAKASPASADRL